MTTLTTRPYAGERDLGAVTELLNQVSQAYGLDDTYAEEDLRLEFADPVDETVRKYTAARVLELPAGAG